VFAAQRKPAVSGKANASPSPPEHRHDDRGAENSAWQQLSLRVQSKLAVVAVDDDSEREADRVAAQVVDSPSPRGGQQIIDTGAIAGNAHASLAAAGIGGTGVPLSESDRRFFEPRFGRSFDDVRIHTGDNAAAAAHALNARAFTLGHDIVFGRGEFDPTQSDGRRLIAHELAHTVQQEEEQSPHIQRDPKDPTPVPVMKGLTMTEYPDKKQVVFAFRDVPLLVVNSYDRSKDFIGIEISGMNRQEMIISIKSGGRIDATIDLDVERAFIASLGLDASALGYDFAFQGTIKVRDGALTTTLKGPQRRVVLVKTEHPVTIEGLPQPPVRVHHEDWLAGKMEDTYPSFKNLAELKKYLEANKTKAFAIVRAPDGRYIAKELKQEDLEALANKARAGVFEKRKLEDIEWYRDAYRRGEFQGVWVGGEEYGDLASLQDVFFSDPDGAMLGTGSQPIECEIYEMLAPDGFNKSYGRRRLSHEEALARWKQFDGLSEDAILKLETIPNRRFFALQARGVSKIHTIGRSYLSARTRFREQLVELDQKGVARDDWRVSVSANAFFDYIDIEIDRSEDNPEFVDALKKYSGMASVYGAMHYQRVVEAGQQWAANSFQKSSNQIKDFVNDDKKLTQWVLSCPLMPRNELYQSLEHLDMMDDTLTYYNALSRPEDAIAIAAGGVGNYVVTLERIRAKALELAKKMDDARDSILKRDIIAIKQKGEFGDSVRLGVYKEYGYQLAPQNFPYKDKLPSSGIGKIDILGGSRSSFVSLGEQIFATQLRREIAEDEAWTWAKRIGLLLATVILVVALNAVGAAIAGAIFAEGTFGYLAITALVVGTGLTAWEFAQAKIAGVDMTWGELLEAELWNVATAGMLGKLGYMFKDAGAVARIGIIGSAGLGLGLARFMAQHKGPVTGEELLEFFIENAVMFAAMEIAGVGARSMNQKAALWGRARRLGVKVQEIETFTKNLRKYMRDLGSYQVRPGEAAREQGKIRTEGEALLAQQEKLVNELNQSLRTKGDAEHVQAETNEELAYIKTALEGMKKANFLAELKLKPVGQSQSIFTFENVPDAARKVQDFFPGSRAELQSDGSIQLWLQGAKDPVILTPAGAKTPAVADVGDAKIDINRATEAELAKLPGIGKKLAKAIVEQRNKNGGRFATVDDLMKVPGVGPATLAKVAPLVVAEDPPTIAQRQTDLATRQQALLDRAARLGYSDSTIEAISKLRPMQSTDPKTLDATEQKIIAAEKKAGTKMDAAAKKALANVSKRLKSEKIFLKTGALSGVSDQQIGDALARVAGRKGLGVDQLRGVIWAHLKGVPIEKFMNMAEGHGTKARNFALETFGRLADANVRNAHRVLSEMVSTPDDFAGGMFVLRLARYGYGIEAIEAFEFRVTAEGYTRNIDIVLKVGLRIEAKNWREWKHRTSLANAADAEKPGQFLKDVAMSKFSPSAFDLHRYVFSYPAPETPANIKAYLRAQLEQFIQGKISPNDAKILLQKFDATKELVTEMKLPSDLSVPLDVPAVPPVLLMPVQPPPDKDKNVPVPAPAP